MLLCPTTRKQFRLTTLAAQVRGLVTLVSLSDQLLPLRGGTAVAGPRSAFFLTSLQPCSPCHSTMHPSSIAISTSPAATGASSAQDAAIPSPSPTAAPSTTASSSHDKHITPLQPLTTSASGGSKPAAADADAGFRYFLFLVLVFSSGCIESFSFGNLNTVFCGYMTGNIVIFGLNLADPTKGGSSLLNSVVALCSFCTGSFVAGQLIVWQSAATVLRRVQLLLVMGVLLLSGAAVVASRVGESDWNGQLPTLTLLALAMALQMTAGTHLAVKWLAAPLATGLTNNLFADNPFIAKNKEKSLKQVSMLLALVLGSLAGGGVTLSRTPWAAVIIAIGVNTASVVLIDAYVRWRLSKERDDPSKI